MEYKHISIMIDEILSGLNIKPDGIYLDCTIGGAGHSLQIIKKLNDKGLLIGIDKDKEAIDVCKTRLKDYKNVILEKSDFKDIAQILDKFNNKRRIKGNKL